MNKPKCIPLVLLLLPILAFGQSGKWKTIQDDNYSIKYPNNWSLDQSGRMGTSFVVMSKKTSENDPFQENINLLIQDIAGTGIKLGQFVAISEQQINSMFTNAKIISSQTLKDNRNIKFHKIIYSANQGIYNLTFEQRFYIKGDKAYILTFASETDRYTKYKSIAGKILNSFRLK